MFTARKVTLKEGETPEPLEIRASPHVVIEAQWVDSKGKPTNGFAGHIFGRDRRRLLVRRGQGRSEMARPSPRSRTGWRRSSST